MSNSILSAFSPIKDVKVEEGEEGTVVEEAEYVEDTAVTSPMIIRSAPGSAKENRRVFDATTPINPRKIARICPTSLIAKNESLIDMDVKSSEKTIAGFAECPLVNVDYNVIQSIVKEEFEELKEIVQRDIRNLHVDLLKGNTILERSIERSLARHLPTVGELLKEIEELRNENKRLRMRLGL